MEIAPNEPFFHSAGIRPTQPGIFLFAGMVQAQMDLSALPEPLGRRCPKGHELIKIQFAAQLRIRTDLLGLTSRSPWP